MAVRAPNAVWMSGTPHFWAVLPTTYDLLTGASNGPCSHTHHCLTLPPRTLPGPSSPVGFYLVCRISAECSLLTLPAVTQICTQCAPQGKCSGPFWRCFHFVAPISDTSGNFLLAQTHRHSGQTHLLVSVTQEGWTCNSEVSMCVF